MGHPLGLTLTWAAAHEQPELILEEAATTLVVTELARIYLQDAPDPLTRCALEAAVVRRVTRPLLGAMRFPTSTNQGSDHAWPRRAA